MNVGVVGTGYVGLVVGTCLADSGNNVICVDIDEEKINNLKKGIIPIYEPGLSDLVKRNTEEKRLFFTTDIEDAVKKSEIIFIAVGTPPDEDGSADLKYVLNVAESIGKYMNDYKIVVDKSTVPVGTADKVKKVIKEELKKRNKDIKFDVVSNPEFLKEGDAINDFLKPDRIIVGAESEKAKKKMLELYAPFVRTGHPILTMDVKSAELSKYAANAMLATRISFMNELSRLCEKVGADIEEVRKGIGTDRRIGPSFLFAGCGFGGSCFPKDVNALIKTFEENGLENHIIKAVNEVNEEQKRVLVEKIKKHYKNDLKGKTFAVWGLSFKPKTDDMREAPSIVIINELREKGAKIKAFDPEAMKEAKRRLGDKNIYYGKDMYDVLKDSDALILITEWNEFRNPDFNKITNLLKDKVIFDGRNQYDIKKMKKLGFKYYSIGRR